MAQKKYKPEEFIATLGQVDALVSQGRPVFKAIRTIGVTVLTYYRWRKEFGGLKSDQIHRLKDLEKENERLRQAVAALTASTSPPGLGALATGGSQPCCTRRPGR